MEDPFENKKPKQEQLVRVEIAKPEDWQAYKEMRLLAINGKEEEICDITSEEAVNEMARTDEEWEKNFREDLSSGNIFVVLSWAGSEVVGLGRIRKIDSEGTWHMGSAYLKKNFRQGFTSIKMFNIGAEEIKKREGKKITIELNIKNPKSPRMAKLLGFKRVGTVSVSGVEKEKMELDLK